MPQGKPIEKAEHPQSKKLTCYLFNALALCWLKLREYCDSSLQDAESRRQHINVRARHLGPADAKQHARGALYSSPHLGLVAEAGPEAIIPLHKSARNLGLLGTAARAMGVSSGSRGHSYTFGDVIVNISGNADRGTADLIARKVQQTFEDRMRAAEKEDYQPALA